MFVFHKKVIAHHVYCVLSHQFLTFSFLALKLAIIYWDPISWSCFLWNSTPTVRRITHFQGAVNAEFSGIKVSHEIGPRCCAAAMICNFFFKRLIRTRLPEPILNRSKKQERDWLARTVHRIFS